MRGINFIILDRGDSWLSLEYDRAVSLLYYVFVLKEFWKREEDLFEFEGLLLFFYKMLQIAKVEVIVFIIFNTKSN